MEKDKGAAFLAENNDVSILGTGEATGCGAAAHEAGGSVLYIEDECL